MKRRVNIVVAGALLGFLLGLPVPVSVGAQGGDAVYRSIRTEIPIAREYLEPQGLQDAASDLLTTEGISTTSNTYVTIMSAAVTVGEFGDAVLVQVRAAFNTGPTVPGPMLNCNFRLTRGTTEIRLLTVRDGVRFLWDSTEVDSPPVGTHTYSLEMRSSDPTVNCSVQSFIGTTSTERLLPLPSLLVQSFYAGSIP